MQNMLLLGLLLLVAIVPVVAASEATGSVAVEVLPRTTMHTGNHPLSFHDFRMNFVIGKFMQRGLIDAYFDCNYMTDVNKNGRIETFPWYSECKMVVKDVHPALR